ncbi:MaoC/PaaZ C-terminal domain-containing protein [Pseudomonas putida]|uniref:3-alpha,7-alpha, 12-alpha-trihydroxy-5-beta-cholest-24-enoyl-CoA hydratase n=1 Tax=Pseudomonas putida TaxID=303 RepID=A0A177SV34_PSEPU|nr:MaoC/PaaZ C-terminal domain-containing protein [Pseudomonas putida]OAI94793.1 3-alpha,7-alpha,12-alpha-trihydroxy-5-beta-cholest-24-enoyl-CoA hydratase [Pseudomonas putida]
MLNYERVKHWPIEEVTQSYSKRDSILYALGLGVGGDPMDPVQLRFTFEKDLQAVPTLAAAIAWPKPWMTNPDTGVDYLKLVHGEQDTEWFRPMPAEATVRSQTRVNRICDKGAGKGAIVELLRDIINVETGERIAQTRQVSFLRGDGGYSAEAGVSDAPPQSLPAVPERAPDFEYELFSPPQAALIYRLSGDSNPLHADPEVASRAGFPQPILHGLATYGMAAFAAVCRCADGDASRLKRLAARFTSPVFPGETLRFQFWSGEEGRIHLRARVDARDVTVLNNGVIELA